MSSADRLDVKALLEKVPVWHGIKRRAEDNNHRMDSRSPGDKFLKSLQQKVLNVLRIHALLHTACSQSGDAEVCSVSQQLFMYLAQVETELVQERKRRSIPGAVQVQDNVLFTTEDLKIQTVSQKINSSLSPSPNFSDNPTSNQCT